MSRTDPSSGLLIPLLFLFYHGQREDRPSRKEEDDGRLSTSGHWNVLDVTHGRRHARAGGYGGAESPGGGRDLRRVASATGPSEMAGPPRPYPTAHGPGPREGICGQGDAAEISRVATTGLCGPGAIWEAVGHPRLRSTAHQNA